MSGPNDDAAQVCDLLQWKDRFDLIADAVGSSQRMMGNRLRMIVSTLDIYRTANILVQQYGSEDAVQMAAKRGDALAELDDIDGQQVWTGAHTREFGLNDN
jgi:hypothetical protein